MAGKKLSAVEIAKKKLADARKKTPEERKRFEDLRSTDSYKEEQLKKKLAAAMPESVAPTMVPAPKKNKKDPEPPPPDLKELDMDDDDRKQLTILVTQAADYKSQASNANKSYAPIADRIKNLLKDMPEANKRFMWWGTKVALRPSSRLTIKADLLLAHGVSPAIISACTKETTSHTLTITPAGASEDE